MPRRPAPRVLGADLSSRVGIPLFPFPPPQGVALVSTGHARRPPGRLVLCCDLKAPPNA